MVIPDSAPPQPQPGSVALIAKPGGTNTGVGRYVQMLHTGLQTAGVATERVAPHAPRLPGLFYTALRRLGPDLRTFFLNYPVAAKYPSADVYHLTSQNLASLLLFRRPPGKVIVTVHDIIPYMLRDDPRFKSYRAAADRYFDRMAMAGLKRADRLIADSRYTKESVVTHLGIAPDKIDVAHLGIDQQRFRRQAVPGNLWERYNLPPKQRYLIYVGSEDPRKNLVTLLRALPVIRREFPEVALLKVGRAHFADERERLLNLAAELGLSSAIYFLDDVLEDDLPLLYNLADLCVMPSRYEGFGFPVLEAMACGTPVVCAEASSLPEIAGDAAMLFDPNDEYSLALAVVRCLADFLRYQHMVSKGLRHAATFTWEQTTRQTLNLYTDLSK